jgi:hypothetical protein
MLFKHEYAAAGTGEEQAGHHPCRAAARNDEIEI